MWVDLTRRFLTVTLYSSLAASRALRTPKVLSGPGLVDKSQLIPKPSPNPY